MLPNHAPLVVAERFGTLEALHPGRIDLGIGRAPGTDQRTMLALRRLGSSDDLLELLRELLRLLQRLRRPATRTRASAPCPATARACRRCGCSARAATAPRRPA